MRNITLFSVLAALTAAPVSSQPGGLAMPASQMPAFVELGSYSLVPWMGEEGRVQQFYDAAEVGAQAFTATGLDLRFDGPIPAVGAPGPFTVDRVKISIGTSTVGTPGPSFAGNVTSPMTVVFDQAVTYWPDQGSFFPSQWGGLNGGLSFPFNAPVSVSIPAGGWLVVEFAISGNNLAGAAHAILDAHQGTGGPYDGAASSSGLGCSVSVGAPPATITTSGVHAPGATHFLEGAELGANAPVLAILGASDTTALFGSLPWNLPGTNCTIYNSWNVFLNSTTDALGQTYANDPALAVVLGVDPALNFVTYYAQFASLVPSANQPWGLVFSDKRTVQLGGVNANTNGMYTISNSLSATASFGDYSGEFGYAMRLSTL